MELDFSNTDLDYSFVFICQKGDLEIKSVLLSMSLFKKLKCSYEIIAAIPEAYGQVYEPVDLTIRLLKALDARIEYFQNKYCIDKRKEIIGDWFSNKAYCIKGIKYKGRKVIFLDSDMIFLKEFKGDSRFFSANFNAKQARFSHIKDWRSLYQLFNLEQPKIKFKCDGDGIFLPPYFNSGFFAIDGDLAEELGEKWLEVFEKITEAEIIPDKVIIRRNQISLAIAVHLMNISYEVMDDSFNFPVGDKLLNPFNSPYIAHYHHVDKIKNILQIKNLINSFCAEWDDLKLMLERDKNWRRILE